MRVTIRKVSLRVTTAVALLALGGIGLSAGNRADAQADISQNIQDYVSIKLDDFTATMKVLQHDDRAGQKINPDFGLIYKIKGDIAIKYKEENKMRLDGYIAASKLVFIMNGTKQYVRSSLGLNDTRDLGNSPGKRKTLLDVGLIASGYLAYTEAQFQGVRPVEGAPCAVFRISYRDKSLDTSHRLVWVDPKTKVTLKREEYSQEGKLNAIFYYKEPKEIAPGVWFPSRIEVFNNQGQKAGVTAYRNVKVNQQLADSLFKL